jgi:plastocyanin
MVRVSRFARLTLIAGVATLMMVGIACSSGASGSASKNGSGSTSTGAVNTSGAITIVGKDNFYEPKEFTGPAGQPITVTLDNQGGAIHDFVIKDQRGPDGQEIQTPLINAKQTGSVQFTLPAGTYDFYCAVHPVEMRGKMTLK